MLLTIYLIGVMINFVVVIMIFSNEDFNIIEKKNSILTNGDKIALLVLCFLSWFLIVHSLIRKNKE